MKKYKKKSLNDNNLSFKEEQLLKQKMIKTQKALKIPYRKAIKGFIGHPLNADTLLHYNSKSVIYSFNKVNNVIPLLSKTESLLKSFFLSMCSLISRPVYLVKHDKIIIRLFVFLSPKVEKFLDSSLIGQGDKLQGHSLSVFKIIRSSISAHQARKVALVRLNKFLKFKKLRPKTVEILKTQIKLNLNFTRTINTFEKIVNSIISTEDKANNFNLSVPYLIYPKDKNMQKENIKVELYTSFVSNFKKRLEKLSIIFSKILKKKIEFEIIKAQLPFQDSNLLSQILGYNAKEYNFRRMLKILVPRAVIKNPSRDLTYASDSPQHKQIFGTGAVITENRSLELKEKKLNTLFSQPSSYLPPSFYSKFYLNFINSILLARPQYPKGVINKERSQPEGSTKYMKKKYNFPSFLSGMNIKLAGRLITQSIRPRFTVQNKQEGSLARVKVHFIEKSRFTGKNKRGVFSFTVTISHVLNK
jgi:Mitochondrial ribosomal protein (VAR1)